MRRAQPDTSVTSVEEILPGQDLLLVSVRPYLAHEANLHDQICRRLGPWGDEFLENEELANQMRAAHLAKQIDTLITDGYREQNEIMHRFNSAYGSFGQKHAATVSKLSETYGRDVLDYGCGKGNLAKALQFAIRNYDPAVTAWSAPPTPADLVVCTDVLEHIEPECLGAVLADLRRLTRKALYIDVSIRPAFKSLPDGRNAHLLVREPDWWVNILSQFFKVTSRAVRGDSLVVLCLATDK